jgi:hypothetical protein
MIDNTLIMSHIVITASMHETRKYKEYQVFFVVGTDTTRQYWQTLSVTHREERQVNRKGKYIMLLF